VRHAERLTGCTPDPAARDPLVDVLTEAAAVLREQRDAYAALMRVYRQALQDIADGDESDQHQSVARAALEDSP